MSYRYQVCRHAQGIKKRIPVEDIEYAPLGTSAQVMAEISAVFPNVRWTQGTDDLSNVWFGDGWPKFQISPESNGDITTVLMGDAKPADLAAIARGMKVFVIDAQQFVLVDV